MLRYLKVALAVGLLAGVTSGADDAKKELDQIQGEWTLASLIIDGQVMPGDAKDVNKVIIKGNKMTVILKSPDGKQEERKSMTMTLSPDKTPKAVDFKSEEGPGKEVTMLGIYELKGDSLRFCSSNPPKSKDRPKEFSANKGSGQALFELKRPKP